MREKIISLKTEHAKMVTEIRSKLESSQPDLTQIKELEARCDSILQEVEALERQLERERIAGEAEKRSYAQDSSENKGKKVTDERLMEAYNNYIRSSTSQIDSMSAQTRYIELNKEYHAERELSFTNPTQAGYLVPPTQMVAGIVELLRDATMFRQKANVLPSLNGAHSLGVVKKTANASTFKWGTEGVQPTADTALAFGKREMKPNPATGSIMVTNKLIRNLPNIASYVNNEMAICAAENLEQAYMTGTGVGQPLGIFIASADGISVDRDVSAGNSTTEVKFDGLYEAKYSVKDAYRIGCEWYFHRTTLKQIAKLKDNDNQYIWQPNVSVGINGSLLGNPVNTSEWIPNTMTTGLYVGMFANYNKLYWIVDSLMFELRALSELYALNDKTLFMYRLETDGQPVDELACARIKLA